MKITPYPTMARYIRTPNKAAAFLPAKFVQMNLERVQMETLIFLSSYLVMDFFLNGCREPWFTEIRKKDLVKIFDHKSQDFLRKIIDDGLIERDGNFVIGKKSYGYRVGKPYRQSIQRYLVSSKIFSNRINRLIKMSKQKINEQHKGDSWMNKCLKSYAGIDRTILNWPIRGITQEEISLVNNMNYLFAMADAFDAGQIHGKVSETNGRFHSPITQMPSELRKFITLRDDKADLFTAEIDVVSSQPYLLASLYNQDNPDEAEELERYLIAVCKKDIYEFLWGDSYSRELRKEIKEELFRDVFYGAVNYNSKVWQKFAHAFPELAAKMEYHKQSNNSKLPLMMQRLEAKAVVSGLSAECAERKIPIITIHDSVRCLKKDIDSVQEMLQRHFMAVTKLTVPPMLTVEDPFIDLSD